MIPNKPKKYLTSTGDMCDRVKVTHLIDKNFLIYAVAYLLNYDGSLPKNKITKKGVEDSLRSHLTYEGSNWADKMSYEVDEKSNRYKNAHEIARKLFPMWFINKNDNALNFIMKEEA